MPIVPFSVLRRLVPLMLVVVACTGRPPAATPASPGTARGAGAGGMQLFLLAGQSNMAGRARVEAQDSVVNPRVMRLAKDSTWVPAVDPLHWDKPAIIGVGPGRAFGLAITARDPSVRVGLIPAAVGGSPISSWEPGALDAATNTHPYDDAMARLRVARTHGRLRAILWHQGESDATPARSVVYADKLRALIARFRSELGEPDLPFLIGQLGQFETRPWTADVRRIDSVHRAIAASVPNVAYVSSDGLRDKGDAVHFDGPAARTLGERYAAAYLGLVKR